jgi:hypothetical protein
VIGISISHKENIVSKHTPGPWTLIAEPELTLIVASAEPQIDDKAFGIALIPHHKDASVISWETKEANAHLIVAAPDMKAALIKCEEALRQYEVFLANSTHEHKGETVAGWSYPAGRDASALALAAIAKAEGRTP